MKIHPVDSKKKMLSEGDILVVAAHEAFPSEEVDASAKQHGISPERLKFTIYGQEIKNPALIRIRDGNTLFTIAGSGDRQGVVFMYNGDTENNVAENFIKFLDAAHHMGFNFLAVRCEDVSLAHAFNEIQDNYKDAQFSYDKNTRLVNVLFSQLHGD